MKRDRWGEFPCETETHPIDVDTHYAEGDCDPLSPSTRYGNVEAFERQERRQRERLLWFGVGVLLAVVIVGGMLLFGNNRRLDSDLQRVAGEGRR